VGLGTHDPSTPAEPSRPHRARFADLVFEHRHRVHGWVRAVYPWADADSVVNAVLAAAWEHLDEIEPDRTRAWLRATARNVISSDNRQRRRYLAVAEKLVQQDAVTTEVAGPEATDRAELDTVLRALATLSEADREILTVAAAEELTPAEIAEILDLDPNVVRVRLSRARARLRDATERSAGTGEVTS
jgi:RNA polymerase sigma-70 factor (ECF subfamily)